MGADSKIEWTDATWNPLRGCTEISPGCAHCYAAVLAARFSGSGQPYEGMAYFDANGRAHWTGKVRTAPEKLSEPFRWKNPRRVFVNSMSDLFHEDVPDEFIDKVFAVMASTGRHTYQVLTKRTERAAAWFSRVSERGLDHANLYTSGLIDFYQRHDVDLSKPYQVPSRPTPELRFLYDSARGIDPWTRIEDRDSTRLHKQDGDYHWRKWPLSNVWIGTSVENQATAEERIPHLLRVPAAVRFLSVEPLLGPVDLPWLRPCTDHFSFGPLYDHGNDEMPFPAIHWVIVGGESGPGARPMHPHWARSIRDQCQAAGVPFFFKQWGEWMPFDGPSDLRVKGVGDKAHVALLREDGRLIRPYSYEDGPGWQMARVGKKLAGRELWGRTWDEFPEVANATL